MSGTVNYPKVIDLLADTIKELNRPCVAAPAAPAERTEAERKQDAAGVLRALLHQLEGGSAGAAAAGHSASNAGSPDCPDSQTVFSYNERTHPAAAG